MNPKPDRPAGERILAGTIATACILVMVGMGLGWHALRYHDTYLGKKNDYYSLEVHGFLAGHGYVDQKADFRRDSPDPAVRAEAPFMLDGSYYRGHYYLYFGVTPAALVLLPYEWLTGSDLDPRVLVVLASVIGFLFAWGTLNMASRDHFGRLGPLFQWAAVPVLAFATAVPMLLTRALFYEVAAATGYACTMAAAFWIYRALFGRAHTGLQLALASVSLGLAVGCRPDLVLNVPLVAAAALWIAGWGRSKAPGTRGLPLLAAAIAPAALIGLGLAVFNYERFGNPLEFGMSYSVNDFVVSHKQLFSLGYLGSNIHWYYFTFPALSPFFPYVFPERASFGPAAYATGEALHGQFPFMVLAGFTLVSALLAGRRLRLAGLGVYLAMLGWMAAALFAALAAIGVRADRYMVDFQPAAALAIVLLAGALLSMPGKSAPSKGWLVSFALLGGLTALFNIFGGLQEFESFKNIRTAAYRKLEWMGNYPSYWLGKLGGLHSGPIEMTVIFPEHLRARTVEPLLTAGTPEYSDTLYAIEWADGRHVEFMGDHRGYGGPVSEVVPIIPGKTYTLTIDMGSLYPPLRHPYFSGSTVLQSRLVKTGLRVSMDGKTVMDARMDSYDAPPGSIEIGKNEMTMMPFKTAFSGRILSVTRRQQAPPEFENTGLWRLQCALPMKGAGGAYPLLSSGCTGSGTLLYVRTLPGNQVRFGLDEWGLGGRESDTVAADPKSGHVIELYIGSVAQGTHWPEQWDIPAEALARFADSLQVWLDGRLVWRTHLQRPLDPRDPLLDVGSNLQGFSTAQADFPGFIRLDPFSDSEARRFLEQNVPKGDTGLWRMECVFPAKELNANYPLISSGVTGSGTLVYLNGLSGDQVRFGVDEWGRGGGFSPPVPKAAGTVHVIEVFDGPLVARTKWPKSWQLSPAKIKSLEHILRIWLDGREIWTAGLEQSWTPTDSQIAVGTNFQGFSTALRDYPSLIQFDPYTEDGKRNFIFRNFAKDQ